MNPTNTKDAQGATVGQRDGGPTTSDAAVERCRSCGLPVTDEYAHAEYLDDGCRDYREGCVDALNAALRAANERAEEAVELLREAWPAIDDEEEYYQELSDRVREWLTVRGYFAATKAPR